MEVDVGLMILFIALWMSIYGGLHYYAYRKYVDVFPDQKRLIISLLIILASSLFVVEIFTHNGLVGLAYPLAGIAYVWMGVVFLFFFISMSLDAAIAILRRLLHSKSKFSLSSKKRTIAVSTLVGVLGLVGYISAKQINVETIVIQTEKIKESIRLVQISDLHLGILSSEEHISRLVDTINRTKPDIVVSTGDLVDMQLDHIRGMASRLSKLNAPLGKFAVYGNHEVFAGLEQADAVIKAAGFQLLSNTGVKIEGLVNLIGVDDPSVAGSFQQSNSLEPAILKSFSSNLYSVLLKHQPVVEEESIPFFDLQLSGHTHGGQIFPFGLFTRLIYPIGFGLSIIDNQTSIYVSRGTGTWGPPMRLLSGAEITVIELLPMP